MASKKRRTPRGRVQSVAFADQRPDRRVALGVAAAAAAIFFATYSPRVALGDSSESVTGVETVGILHAPGYPVYVLAARLFASVIPVGELAARVNLFSLVCAVAAVTLTFLTAQRLGASAVAAAAGALTLATGTSFWFYATFAKHYPFSALLVAGATYLVVRWLGAPQLWRLIAAAALLGLLAGAAWQLAVLALPPLALLVLLYRRPAVAHIAASAAAFVAVAVGVVAYTLIRASQNPAMNWGGASSTARLMELLTLEDFGFGWNAFGAEDDLTQKGVNESDFASFPIRVLRYLVLIVREWNVVAVLLAAYGVWTTRRSRPVSAFLLAAIGINLIGAGFVIGLRLLPNMNTVLAQGGFLIGLFFVLAISLALGIDAVVAAVRRARYNKRTRLLKPAIPWVLAAVVVVPALATHFVWANQRTPAFAEQYAANIFDSLPENAVLFVWGAERAFPLQYAQIVEGERPDVTIVYAEAVARPWYQEQLARELDDLTFTGGIDPRPIAADLIRQSDETRPTFMDMRAVEMLKDRVGSRLRGLVAEPEGGRGRTALSAAELRELEKTVEGYATDGVYHDSYRRRFPNGRILRAYSKMHSEMSALYLINRNSERTRYHSRLAKEVIDTEVPGGRKDSH